MITKNKVYPYICSIFLLGGGGGGGVYSTIVDRLKQKTVWILGQVVFLSGPNLWRIL